MFEEKSALFIYCVSPVHMGAGTALGAVDNPIQREVHTGHPTMAGSGLKGAFRDVFEAAQGTEAANAIFGPSTDASDHAGAVSFADAQLVLFPVRSLRSSFVYATCPTALARLQRLLVLAGVEEAGSWEIPPISGEACAVVEGTPAATADQLILEAYEFKPKRPEGLAAIASWIGANALPADDGSSFFRKKVEQDLVVLSDERFNHFVQHATLVEPHVRINDETGTADDGGLFYTENLPPEALLVSMVMASKQRTKKSGSDAEGLSAKKVIESVRGALDNHLAQVGGDATTGRGQVVLRFTGGA